MGRKSRVSAEQQAAEQNEEDSDEILDWHGISGTVAERSAQIVLNEDDNKQQQQRRRRKKSSPASAKLTDTGPEADSAESEDQRRSEGSEEENSRHEPTPKMEDAVYPEQAGRGTAGSSGGGDRPRCCSPIPLYLRGNAKTQPPPPPPPRPARAAEQPAPNDQLPGFPPQEPPVHSWGSGRRAPGPVIPPQLMDYNFLLRRTFPQATQAADMHTTNNNTNIPMSDQEMPMLDNLMRRMPMPNPQFWRCVQASAVMHSNTGKRLPDCFPHWAEEQVNQVEWGRTTNDNNFAFLSIEYLTLIYGLHYGVFHIMHDYNNRNPGWLNHRNVKQTARRLCTSLAVRLAMQSDWDALIEEGYVHNLPHYTSGNFRVETRIACPVGEDDPNSRFHYNFCPPVPTPYTEACHDTVSFTVTLKREPV